MFESQDVPKLKLCVLVQYNRLMFAGEYDLLAGDLSAQCGQYAGIQLLFIFFFFVQCSLLQYFYVLQTLIILANYLMREIGFLKTLFPKPSRRQIKTENMSQIFTARTKLFSRPVIINTVIFLSKARLQRLQFAAVNDLHQRKKDGQSMTVKSIFLVGLSVFFQNCITVTRIETNFYIKSTDLLFSFASVCHLISVCNFQFLQLQCRQVLERNSTQHLNLVSFQQGK